MLVSNYQSVKFGADPEGFFQNSKGRIVGSELVIPRKLKWGESEVVRDGVQFELHYPATIFRDEFPDLIADSFHAIKDRLSRLDGITVCTKQVVRMTPGELKVLSPKSRELGCMPSENIYEPDAELGVDPKTYKVRSAGGHVHLGLSVPKLKDEYRRIVRMCDILLGNQCVLLDRDPLQALRRRVYGRAGECRKQKYGLEYRTLSNFWLRSEPLVGFVLSMARKAVQVIATTEGVAGIEKWDAERSIFADYGIQIKDVRKAIDRNDFDLALKNYEKIEEFLTEHFDYDSDGLNSRNVHRFRQLVRKIDENGIESVFPKDPIDYWTGKRKKQTWEQFLRTL